jgi:hypothetical protein
MLSPRNAHLASDTLTDATEIMDGIVAAQPRMVMPPAVEEMWRVVIASPGE